MRSVPRDTVLLLDTISTPKGSLTERLFGRGGLRLRLQGDAQMTLGVRSRVSDLPLLSEQLRQSRGLELGERIQAGVEATLGTKLKLLVNYNTSSTFSSDAKMFRLTYEGDSTDFVKLIELGRVGLQPHNTLLSLPQGLWGVHTQFQLGKLKLHLLASQQRSSRQRIVAPRGEQDRQLQLSASDYDADRHFFLGSYFRTHYDQALSHLPSISSSVRITRVEVWVGASKELRTQTRRVEAFAALGEEQGSAIPPALGIDGVLPPATWMEGQDYEQMATARLLSPAEYDLNAELGYISLVQKLAPGQTLAVAYEYVYEGRVYRVGTLSGDANVGVEAVPILKLLRASEPVPGSLCWSFMMRNVYQLGQGDVGIRQEGFRLDVRYQHGGVGALQTALPDGVGNGKSLLALLGADQLTFSGQAGQDGRFDYLEGYTINSKRGWIYFPTVEPFGKTLQEQLSSSNHSSLYAYDELYSTMQTAAKALTSKDKYYIYGTYRAQGRGEISLGVLGVSPGAVHVYAGGNELREGEDYTVDYFSGLVHLGEKWLYSAASIEATVDDVASSIEQRRTLLGVDMDYHLSKHFRLGATWAYLSEAPLSSSARVEEEALRRSMWGARLSYSQRGKGLTKLLNALPWLGLKQESELSFVAEVAGLSTRQNLSSGGRERIYLDDFENTRSALDLTNPLAWSLASLPVRLERSPAGRAISSGDYRARFAWYSIDPIFTRTTRSSRPLIRGVLSPREQDLVRDIPIQELYPERQVGVGDQGYLSVLNLSYYPSERGPYNLSTERVLPSGYFADPSSSWGGMMRQLEIRDFEESNVEYLDLWLLLPPPSEASGKVGTMYIDMGNISEDVLPDGLCASEAAIPSYASGAEFVESPWGRIARYPATSEVFDNSSGGRARQDVGLDGLSTQDESAAQPYADYLALLRRRLSPEVALAYANDPLSPLRDPAGDDYHHYLGSDYDAQGLSVVQRYKYYNGLEGNASGGSDGGRPATTQPDTEDIDHNGSLGQSNRYWSYRIPLQLDELGRSGYVIEERRPTTMLSDSRWCHLRIPIMSFTESVGGGANLRDMRAMRLYLSDASEECHLRIASMRLVSGAWRIYDGSLSRDATHSEARLQLGSIGMEEGAQRRPVSYVLPPGLERESQLSTTQLLERDEQSMSMRVESLPAQVSVAAYRRVHHDLRRYHKLRMRVHAESLEQDPSFKDGDLELFLRLGADDQYNYYEYSLPLRLTPHGSYQSSSPIDRLTVWPEANAIEVDLESLVALKRKRPQSSIGSTYVEPNPLVEGHMIGVVGNPSLSRVQLLMLGIRNRSGQMHGAEIWVDELRVDDRVEPSAWAARARLNLRLAELGSATLLGSYTSSGFGAIDQLPREQSLEQRASLQLSAQVDLGRLLPQSAAVALPISYSLSRDITHPEYHPQSDDQSADLGSEIDDDRDGGRRLRSLVHQETLALTEARLGIRSKIAMPYDPANVSLSVVHAHSQREHPTLGQAYRLDEQLSLSYDYSPEWKSLRPFASLKGASWWSRFWQRYTLSLWPSKVHLSTSLVRSYEEEQTPDLSSQTEHLPLYFAHDFVWTRNLYLLWSPIPRLTLSLSMGTDARIEEPQVRINKTLAPDDYALWRSSVLESLRHWGTPMRYVQTSTLSYTLPISQVAPLDWLTAQGSYTGSYRWSLGAERVAGSGQRLPNAIDNQLTLEGSGQMRLRNLYSKIDYLKRIDEHYRGRSTRQDSLHGGGSLGGRLRDALVGGLLMLRDVSWSYRYTTTTLLPSFLPSIGNWGGQGSLGGEHVPGLSFALAWTGEDYIDRARERGWLESADDRARPAVYTRYRSLDVKATLQPLRDLHIVLTWSYNQSQRTEHLYYVEGRPHYTSADLLQTGIGLRGFFDRPRVEDSYRSPQLSAMARQLSEQGSLGHTTDALLQAFASSYLSGRAHGASPLSRLGSTLPNWSINYTGLGRLPILAKYLRQLSLRHAYRATYRVDGYSEDLEGARSMGSATLQESFHPLLGGELVLRNGVGISSQWRESRSLLLSGGGVDRLVESRSSDWVLGLSYRVADLYALVAPGRRSKNRANAAPHGLTLRIDYTHRHTQTLVHQLYEWYSRATAGILERRCSLAMEYDLSRVLQLRGFYEQMISSPLVGSLSTPIRDSYYGVTLRISLTP